LAVRGIARDAIVGSGEMAGLAIEGRGVVLSALRRQGDWLEIRLVAEHPTATEAVVRGEFREARVVDLLGREGAILAVEAGSVLRLPLGAWEIATLRLR
jgi:alpha-mannosidase